MLKKKLKEELPIKVDIKKTTVKKFKEDDSEMDFGESDFSPIEEQSPMQILNSLQDKENVEMQTEIQQPLNLTRLETLAKWCGDEKAPDSQTTLMTFVNDYRINMVSFDRKSRKEIITALTESIKEERKLSDKLMTLPEKT
jgi:hypothetical protein